jgi:hypothetical protein
MAVQSHMYALNLDALSIRAVKLSFLYERRSVERQFSGDPRDE